jgi:threonyl-tRNA synthetase
MKALLSNEDDEVARTEALRTYWHSAAHVLGQALELGLKTESGDPLQVLLCDGPPLVGEGTDQGFYYQVALPDGAVIDDQTKDELEHQMKLIAREKQTFERLEVTRDFATTLFEENEYKLSLLDRIPKDELITVYRNGPFVDLCRGPHVADTSLFGAIKLLKTSASHFRIKNVNKDDDGLDEMKPVQRVYGITFRKPKELKQYEKQMKMARERDHRLIGTAQGLFMFDVSSPGSPFFLPHGTKIINRLTSMLRTIYYQQNYNEVRTPLIYHKDLWKTSGHLDNYADDMYGIVEGFECNHDDEVQYGLKPMNCPAHCLMFKASKKSYRDLPLRYSDFGSLHRNEISGSLRGLTRVRCFHQDDAHIFCTMDQIGTEILDCLKFIDQVYIHKFGFTKLKIQLSTRPSKKAGSDDVWDIAENELERMLNLYQKNKQQNDGNTGGGEWSFNNGDGAFYGPKIDIQVQDVMGRYHQVATVQLDFQLPERFELEYLTKENSTERPVMVHRAVLGSMERMIAILTEHWGGRWPLWLSPRQIAVCPVSDAHTTYASHVQQLLRNTWLQTSSEPLHDEIMTNNDTLKKKISNAQRMQFNYILVVGDAEEKNETVNVRTRDGQVLGEMKIPDFIVLIKEEMSKDAAPSL